MAATGVPDEVLVVRLGAIGDVTNALVFAHALKESFPGTRIGWAVHDLARPLVEGHPAVDRVHPWRRGSGLGGLLRLVREVRAVGYGLAVDLQRITKSALLARLSGAPRVLGYDRGRAKEGSWLWTRERIPAGDPRAHMLEQYLEFARHLGARVAGDPRRLPADAQADRWAAALVDELGGAPVVVNLGATKPANRWGAERFGELAAGILAGDGPPVCLTGGPDDHDVAERAAAAAELAGLVPRNLVGRTSLLELIALLRRARLFVGCDTGPMHLAAAVGTPVLALFGPADPARTGPWGAGHRVLRVPPPCAPCGRRTCNQPRHACMEDLTVPLVLGAVRESLAAPAVR